MLDCALFLLGLPKEGPCEELNWCPVLIADRMVLVNESVGETDTYYPDLAAGCRCSERGGMCRGCNIEIGA